ncbi:MAG TPA: hypothetical protein VMU34_15555, partial [Mycobacterium sp.]|nr:hypothetical protein [Mycobacterium sp.]
MNLAKNVTGGTTGRAAGLVPAGAGQPADAPRPEFAALAEVAVGHGPIGDIAAAPDRSALIVANHGDDSISILEPRDLAERATVLLPGEPIGVAAAAGRVYVATTSAVYDAVSVVDTDRAMILATYPLDLGITAIGGDGGRIVVGQTGRGKTDLAIVDTTTGAVSAFALATVAGVVVDAVHVSRDGRRVCVGLSDADGGEVQLMSGSRVPARVAVESPIRDIALSPDGNIAYALVCGTGGASLQI